MEVRNIQRVGVPARDYDAMVTFLRKVLTLRVNFSEPATTGFSTAEGDEYKVSDRTKIVSNRFAETIFGKRPCAPETNFGPADLTARTRPEVRPETRAANLFSSFIEGEDDDSAGDKFHDPGGKKAFLARSIALC